MRKENSNPTLPYPRCFDRVRRRDVDRPSRRPAPDAGAGAHEGRQEVPSSGPRVCAGGECGALLAAIRWYVVA